MDNSTITSAVNSALNETKSFLCDFLRFPSTPGNEHEAMIWLEKQFADPNVDCERVPMYDALKQDPDYSDPVPNISYDGRFNLRLRRGGSGNGRTLLLNAHTDVVPPSDGQENPWQPTVKEDTIIARGACDDKGPVACIFLVMKALEKLNAKTAGDLLVHLVCEEENGGNGSLAMARAGEDADGCVVLEPSDRRVFSSIRGAVWFRIVFNGKAGHSGQAGKTRSALLMARDAIALLEQYHDDLLKASRGFPLFDPYPNPMPITFGRLDAGNWPAAAPSKAVLEGVLGLLPNKSKEDVCAEMEACLLDSGKFSHSDFDLSFMYRHDCSVVPVDHDLPQALLRAGEQHDVHLEIDAMTASCDAWFYNNQLSIPTIVYGPGSLSVAHSKDEQIRMSEIAEAATVLVQLILQYCGSA